MSRLTSLQSASRKFLKNLAGLQLFWERAIPVIQRRTPVSDLGGSWEERVRMIVIIMCRLLRLDSGKTEQSRRHDNKNSGIT